MKKVNSVLKIKRKAAFTFSQNKFGNPSGDPTTITITTIPTLSANCTV